MLSLFPQMFDFSLYAIVTLRIIVGLIFILEGYEMFSKKRDLYYVFLSVVSFVGGLMLIFGFLTQAFAIILSSVSIKKMYIAYSGNTDAISIRYYLLLFVAAISLLFFGPGMWSIDYPL